MKLYSASLTLFGRKVEIALAEKGLAFERIQVAFDQIVGYHPKHPDVLAANPKRQIPVFVDDGLTLYDSTVIVEYLEDAYPIPALYPADPRERAICRQFEAFAGEVMLPLIRPLMHRNGERLPPDALVRAEALASVAESDIAGHFATLDERLRQRAHVCGGFSVADIGLYLATLYVKRLGGPEIAAYPALARWFARLGERPAFALVTREIAEADATLSFPLQRL